MTTRSPNTAGPSRRLPIGTIVRATDADSLAVGILTRYAGPTDPYPGVPHIRPLNGGALWQAVPECLRPARPDEIARVQAEADR